MKLKQPNSDATILSTSLGKLTLNHKKWREHGLIGKNIRVLKI